MRYSYLLIDDDETAIKETLKIFEGFPEFYCIGVANNKSEAVDKILELQPHLVLLEVAGKSKKNELSLCIISDLYQYINFVPYFIVYTSGTKYAYDAIKAGASDYLLKPLSLSELRKSLLRFGKSNPVQKTDTICIRSYGDYQFIPIEEIVYLKADNNTTDFYLRGGRRLTAYKTLKHYEENLPLHFFRIHNSYVVNSKYVSRINTGKSLCYLNDGEIAVSFSKTFKDNIDSIIRNIAPESL